MCNVLNVLMRQNWKSFFVETTIRMQNCLYKLQKWTEVKQMKFTEVQSIVPLILLLRYSPVPAPSLPYCQRQTVISCIKAP